MTQISRPFQIALAAVVLLAAVWFVALRGHSSGGSSSTPAASAPAPASSASSSSSTAASTSPRGGGSKAAQAQTSSASAPDVADLTRAIAKAKSTVDANTKRLQRKAAETANKQALVEGELEHGQTVIVLFWSPKGAVDVSVRRQLAQLHGRAQNKDVAVHYSSSAEVGEYGKITGSLQVLQTPTLLVISPSGKTKTLTGLVDAYAIQQAIAEARHS